MKKIHVLAAGSAASLLAAAVYRRKKQITLSGKLVLVTGGSRGLGLEIARCCGHEGARLVLIARDKVELRTAKERLASDGISSVQTLVCDLRNHQETKQAIAELEDRGETIDVLINNAGIIFVGPLASFGIDEYMEAMQTNYFGAVHTTLSVLPSMLRRRSGSIVNIGSIGGKVAFPHLLPYVASKFALVGWSHGLRTELSQYGIRVTTVNPGVMSTGSHVQAFFKGNAKAEYRWFAASTNQPLTAIDPKHAAAQIVSALLRGKSEIQIGLQAKLAARASALAPSLTMAALSLVSRLLPSAPTHAAPEPAVRGMKFRGSLIPLVERKGEAAMVEHNQTS